jgi:hypothetical protein
VRFSLRKEGRKGKKEGRGEGGKEKRERGREEKRIKYKTRCCGSCL